MPVWGMGSGAIRVGASQHSVTLATLKSKGSLVLAANDEARYPKPCRCLIEDDFDELGVPQAVACVWCMPAGASGPSV